MASKTGAIWALDLGNNAVKALRLSVATGVVEVIGFDSVQHSKILTSNELQEGEKDELIALSLRQLVSQNEMENDDIIISVPSQNSFARFVNLPPVEKKKIPEIVTFEAAQQIPFDINSVQWDWQIMGETESGENTVGIFAIKNEEINSLLDYFNGEGIQVNFVQMAPMALYNYISYDCIEILEKSEHNGIITLDIGAENTDLVVSTQSTVWQRSIPMGGHTFTKAIAEAFKLNFAKAEKLKRTAPMSKYARQIYQAMKPVFTDLASEIQRSLNFYSRSYTNTKFCKAIALGGGTKMRGLLKYLQQTLQVTVERPDSFKKLALNPEISAAKFHENVSDFGIVYGLALQGLGFGKIESNLLPRSISRSMAWASKTKYFVAAAFLILLVSLMSFGRTLLDKMNYDKQEAVRSNIKKISSEAKTAVNKLSTEEGKSSQLKAQINKAREPFQNRDVLPLLMQTILSALPSENNTNDPAQKALYIAFNEDNVSKIRKIPRKERKQLFVTTMSINYTDDIAGSGFAGMDFQKGSRSRKSKKSSRSRRPSLADLLQKKFSGAKGGGQFGLQKIQKGATGGAVQDETVEGKPGFVISIAGYSPYKNPIELIDPSGAGNNPDLWGLVTRLMHLDEISGGQSPFKLYEKGNKDHFVYKIELVDITKEMPAGIGKIQEREVSTRDGNKYVENTLIDPMTKETISTVSAVDEDGREKLEAGKPIIEQNDHWFTIDMKFVWETEPTESTESSPKAPSAGKSMVPPLGKKI
ncbi:MAG: type IV pilus assembly protein PilM [Planctomycetota bacterium]|jgi:type IV pilus assembly protein PilM